jgi:hypothetical protein
MIIEICAANAHPILLSGWVANPATSLFGGTRHPQTIIQDVSGTHHTLNLPYEVFHFTISTALKTGLTVVSFSPDSIDKLIGIYKKNLPQRGDGTIHPQKPAGKHL